MTNTALNIKKKAATAVRPAQSARSPRSARSAQSNESGRKAKPIKRKGPARRPAPVSKATKTDQVLKLLRRAKGASIADIAAATGWQAHSVRGFLSGTVKKKLGLTVVSEKDAKAVRRYRIAKDGSS